jgi:hypothetical protein
MSHRAITPPTALFSGGKVSADSFSVRREVERRSGNASEERVLSFAVGAGGFLPREGKGSRMVVGSWPRTMWG